MFRPRSTDVWFNAPGVAAAYQPIAAPDSFLARWNIGDDGKLAGSYTATSAALPTWSAASGWEISIGSYLDSKYIPHGNSSLLVRFSNSNSADTSPMCGKVDAIGGYFRRFGLFPRYSGAPPDRVLWYAGNNFLAGSPPEMIKGVAAIAGLRCFRNGALEAIQIATWTGYDAYSVFIGKMNQYHGTWGGRIQAFALCDIQLSNASVAQYSRQMAYCEQNPDWNAWARRRHYYYAPSVAAAAVFNPAWARNTNTVINQVNL